MYVALALWLMTPPTFAEAAPPDDNPIPWTKLALSPAAAPEPALKYQLLPELRDTTPGNAAVLYQRAHSAEWWSGVRRSKDYEKYYDWLELPLDKFPRGKAAGLIPKHALQEVDRAARRAYCDWELTDRLRQDGINMLIPDVQSFREYAAMLRLRARVEMVDRQFDKAIYTLQTGYALGRHVGDGPTLIQGLVGIAIASIMNGEVELLIQQPGAPNLYWALTDLPTSFVDLRKPIQGERIVAEAIFPGLSELLRDVRGRALTPQEIRNHIERMAQIDGGKSGSDAFLGVAFLAAQVYPEAKKFLIAQGRKAEEVEAMPVVQVGLLFALHDYERGLDDMRKWLSVPYPEAQAGLKKVAQDLKKRRMEEPRITTILT